MQSLVAISPLVLIMSIAVAVLFTLSGLGSIIMVGPIVLPILISVGVPAASAAYYCIFLRHLPLVPALNIANWVNLRKAFQPRHAQGFRALRIYLAVATGIV